jgi:hypothetical protein
VPLPEAIGVAAMPYRNRLKSLLNRGTCAVAALTLFVAI